MNGRKLIGVAHLKQIDNILELCDQFDIEQFASIQDNSFKAFQILNFVLSQTYQNRSRPILQVSIFNLFNLFQDLLTLTNSSMFIHTTGGGMQGVEADVYNVFIPVKGRRRVQYLNNKRDGIELPNSFHYNLLLTTPALLLEYKVCICSCLISKI